ncbi:MAG: NAD-dependent epimerase/dehydratase family protein [Gammaproteobacteria bacterium]|nr:NAD-dependent epimerase/dehydratase family protein [Gammaproteobacteria bacterium]
MADDGGVARIALTGATGFVGSHLQTSLLARGYAVRALVRAGSPNVSRLAADTECFQAELHEQTRIAAAMEGVTAAIYCAGSVRGRSPGDFASANVRGVANVAAACAAHGVPLLLMSSLAASRPEVSDYAASKRAGEQALQDVPGLQWTVFRPPAIYGPGDQEMLPLLKLMRAGIQPRLGPAGQRISLLNVKDLAAAVVSWLDHRAVCAGQTYSLDDGFPGGYDWPAMTAELAGRSTVQVPVPRALLAGVAAINRTLSGLFGYAPMLTPGKVRELWQQEWLCDNGAFFIATGWQPTVPLAAGAQELFGG